MRLKMSAPARAVALLSAIVSSAKDDNQGKTRTNPARWQRRLCRICIQARPPAQAAIQKSPDTQFSNTGVNLLLSTARGSGIALNSETKREPS
jgi:hypothetical protein